MPEPATTGDVAEALAETARATILNHRQAIERGAGHLRGLTIELETKGSGEVTESRIWIEHCGLTSATMITAGATGRRLTST